MSILSNSKDETGKGSNSNDSELSRRSIRRDLLSLGCTFPHATLAEPDTSSAAYLAHDFITRCEGLQMERSAEEMGMRVSRGGWTSYAEGVHVRLEAVREALSERIVSLASPEGLGFLQGDLGELRSPSLFQIHTDNHCSFWVGAPATQNTFLSVLKGAIERARPFESEDLRQVVTDIFLSHCYAGTVSLPRFTYAAVRPSFVTLRYLERTDSNTL